MAIEVNTYLVTGGAYLPLADVREPIADPDYIEGAIELTIDGRAIITRAEWDLVDQLWAYLIDGVVEVASGRSFSTGFPDQAVKLRFTVNPEDDTVTVEVHYPRMGRDARATLPRREFVGAMASAAEPVFIRLIELAPGNREGYERVLQQLAALQRASS